jgi:hypothetical protein
MMPRYQHPGVYIEEYDDFAKPIPGVSTRIDDVTFRSLVAELHALVRRTQPDWTDFNESDPGITLLELLAWLSELAAGNFDAIPERGRLAAVRAAGMLAALSGPCGHVGGAGLKRPSFFAGQLLDAESLQAEVDYFREKLRRHNRELHGFGVVHGLGVRVEGTAEAPDGRIHVEPGYALDPCGDEIVLAPGAVIALPHAGKQLFVSLRYWDRPCSPEPSPAGNQTPARIEEACVVSVTDAVPDRAVAVARLVRPENRWRVDPGFAPRRISRHSDLGA